MSAQVEFDKKYISSTEVCQHLGVHRTTVLLAMRAGRLPAAIVLKRPNGTPALMLWDRVELTPILAAWSEARAERAVA